MFYNIELIYHFQTSFGIFVENIISFSQKCSLIINENISKDFNTQSIKIKYELNVTNVSLNKPSFKLKIVTRQ